MKSTKILKKASLVLLSILTLLTVFLYQNSAYAGTIPTNLNNNWAIILFSLGLLVIVGFTVFLLWFNGKSLTNQSPEAIFEFQRLSFASVLLTGLGLIFLESMAMYYWSSDNSEAGKNIFEACKTIIPPIITLVIGYYFGKSEHRQKNDD